MRILAITATYPPSTNGISISIRIQKEEFEKRGHKFVVLAPKHPQEISQADVVRLPSLPNPKIPDYPIILPFPSPSQFNRLSRGFDLVYFHHPFIVADLAFLLTRTNNCPAVFFHHTQYSDHMTSFIPKVLPVKSISQWVDKQVTSQANRADHVIVETPSTKKIITAKGVTSPVSVIPTSRRFPPVSASKKSLRAKYKLPLSHTILLCVSRLSKEKNLDTLIEAFAAISRPGLLLCFAGMGPDSARLQNLASKLNLTNIIFLGNIPFSDIQEVYALADIFVYPSLTDTQAIVILESMSQGLPVIAFHAPGPKDFVAHGRSGFLARTPRQLARYMQVLSSQPQLLTRLSAHSQKLSQKYSLDQSIDKTETLFKKTISR